MCCSMFERIINGITDNKFKFLVKTCAGMCIYIGQYYQYTQKRTCTYIKGCDK